MRPTMISTPSALRACIVAFAMLHLAGVAHAEVDHDAIFEEAVQALNNNYRQSWAFTETSVETEAVLVGRFDPRRPSGERWTLLSIDDREPTADEIEDYLDDRDDDEGEENTDSVDIMVEDGSLVLLEETNEHYLYSFTPSGNDEDFMEYVDATIKIVKDGPYIEYIDLQASKPFRPQFGVKVSEFTTRMSFGPAAEGGPIVPRLIDIRIKLRAFVVINVDEKNFISYSDYEFVGD
jgi:hypothetical protein